MVGLEQYKRTPRLNVLGINLLTRFLSAISVRPILFPLPFLYSSINLGQRQFFSAEVRGFGDSSSGFVGDKFLLGSFKIVLYDINSLAEVLSDEFDYYWSILDACRVNRSLEEAMKMGKIKGSRTLMHTPVPLGVRKFKSFSCAHWNVRTPLHTPVPQPVQDLKNKPSGVPLGVRSSLRSSLYTLPLI
ncbi:uncharacterized protein LOC116002014 [Ipomoea triloba]|uniref:uncharacterized protein LOC116002014 n=1 Tax=Ipomoea triloba TaxID=35885 RepID=UPI00125DD60E|nr:uncharacterized protein LOC116002014 [Ipomoea triloba]